MQRIKGGLPKSRLESLTDLVFGLALSIGSLSLLAKSPTTPSDVVTAVSGFAFSFLILITIWFRYTKIMSVLPMETGGTMVLNGIMLFLVSIEPYLLGVLTSGSFNGSNAALQNFASQAYALDLGGLTLIMGLFAHELTTERRGQLTPELIGEYRRVRNTEYFVGAWFALSALPFFWSWEVLGTPARITLWYFALIFAWLSRLIGKMS